MSRHLTFLIFCICAAAAPLRADQVISDPLIVRSDMCVGSDDCTIGEPFPNEADIKVRSVVPRILFDDDSVSPGAPNTDWSIGSYNEARLGWFQIREESSDHVPFTVQDGAPGARLHVGGTNTSSLIGVGWSRPEMNLHIFDLDTPTIRLHARDVSNASQHWDMGGNEANFFIRDGSANALPFRIKPGAPTNSFYIREDGDIGVGTANPVAKVHIRANQPRNVPHLVLDSPSNSGRAEIWFQDGRTRVDNDALRLQLNGDNFNISFNGTGGTELRVAKSGDVSVMRGDLLVPNGGVVVRGRGLNVPDYVFAEDYELMPLSEVAAFIEANSHLPHVPSAAEVEAEGLDMVQMQLAMLRTIEEQMLHILALRSEVDALRAQLQ